MGLAHVIPALFSRAGRDMSSLREMVPLGFCIAHLLFNE